LGIVSGGVCDDCGWFLSQDVFELMEGWTSGHEKYDEMIRKTQKDVNDVIPYP